MHGIGLDAQETVAMPDSALRDPVLDPQWGHTLIEAARKPRFACTLLDVARQCDAIDEVFAYQADAQGAIQILLSSGQSRGVEERTGAYAQRFFAQDPVLAERGVMPQQGGFTQQVRAADLPNGAYRDLCYEQPGFQEKISVGWRSGACTTVLSFYRGRQARAPANAAQLAVLGQMALSALSFRVQQPPQVLAPSDARTVLLARLVRTFPLLTEREREITARSILGESAAEIGAALAIKPATVHTYRLRAYARYGFSRSSDFLTALLD